jgi:hypothetical protein
MSRFELKPNFLIPLSGGEDSCHFCGAGRRGAQRASLVPSKMKMTFDYRWGATR